MSADAGLAWRAFAVDASVLRRSPPGVREHLRVLSDRWRGAEAAELRKRPIPQAYRMLARRLGIEPDEHRIPVEAYVADRLVHGAFRSGGLLADALLIATVETGVGVWALDADRVAAGPRREGREIVDGAGVVVAHMFEPVLEAFAVRAATRRVVLYAIVAPLVPPAAVEEALWTARSVIDSG